MIPSRFAPSFTPVAGRSSRAHAWPIFALSLAGLIAAAGSAAAGPALPTGGQVQAGSATIHTSTGFSVTVDQSSSRAVIDWTSFSIGAGGSVQFDNGSGVTLNRVTGGVGSIIDGQLSATGAVYLINPSGVIVGPDGVVSVGGGFVASTLDVTNSQFMSGGDLTFSGSGGGSVINQGAIDAADGDAVLIGATVENNGQIRAPKGVAGLAAGHQVLLRAEAQDDGKLSVLIGGPNTSVTNTGLIAAASAELRANGGDVYALAVNTGSQIEVTGVSAADGKVFLVADGGTVVAQGQIDAVNADGSGGFVETSGQTVDFTGLAVRAGNWLIDPVNLTVNAAAAATISTDLATTSVTLMTTASSASGPGVQSPGPGDITVTAPISWTSANTLTLDAYHSIIIDANLTASGPGKVAFKTDDGGTGGAYWFGSGASLDFTDAPGSGQALTINGQAYTLVYSEADLLKINNNLAGYYALAAPLDLSGIGFGGAPIASSFSTPFTGVFTGLGNTISNLAILRSLTVLTIGPKGGVSNGLVGLFGDVGAGGVIQSVNLVNVDVSGGDGMSVGALAGFLGGTVFNASSSGQVSVGNEVVTTDGPALASAGGLVGADVAGTVLDSNSSANVSGGQAWVGGLIGAAVAGARIVDSFATGDVTAGGFTDLSLSQPEAGGLVGLIYGFDAGTISVVTATGSWATGNVSGGADAQIGGFVGGVAEGQITSSYATGTVALTAPGVAGNIGVAGGFVGDLSSGGTITQSYASGAVSGIGGPNNSYDTWVGGFAGGADSGGAISNSYALGSVTATGGTFSIAGGFAGAIISGATVGTVYATGLVTGSGIVGGLAGAVGSSNTGGSITNSYWDEGTTGQTVGYHLSGTGTATNVTGVGGNTGLSPYATATYAKFDLANTWYMIAGETRPILRSEYSTTITNAHQLQLMALNLSADYTLADDIDASGTSLASGVWNPANGFVPIGGNGAAGFTGVFNGQNFTISNLTIVDTRPVAQVLVDGYASDGVAGLFGFVDVGGLIENVDLVNADVTGGNGMWVGALVGALMGTVTDSSSSGVIVTGNEASTVNGPAYALAGGLVGGMGGSVLASSSSADVSGGDAIVGGLVGGAAHGANIANSFATGSVATGVSSASFNTSPAAGGLVGGINGLFFGTNNIVPVTVSGSYATGDVSGGGGANVGGFVGSVTESTITTSYATGSATELVGGATGISDAVGGFAGGVDTGGVITQSWASGDVTTVAGPDGNNTTFAGGFVGNLNASTVSDAYALGSVTVTGGSFSEVGGFVGQVRNGSSARNIYATGAVSGSNGGVTGGLAGQVGDANAGNTGGSITNGYWDEGTTGQTVGYTLAGNGTATNIVGIGDDTGLSPYATATYANFDMVNTWYMIAGETRPILRAEYSTTITDGHQLELMALNLGASYTLANNIDLSDDTLAAGIWNPANGFVPVGGNGAAAFTGVLNGQGYTISNLTIIDTTASATAGVNTDGLVGLIGYAGAGSLLENVNLANANVTGGNGMRVGALVGFDSGGELLDDTSWGTVTVGGGVSNPSFISAAAGGLAGASSGSIVDSSSSATVTAGANAYAGGLVGSFFGSDITGSYATGNVATGANLLPNSNPIGPLAGGLAGLIANSAVVSDSYATGNVSGGAGSSIGGFAGVIQQSAQVERSYATGRVTQTAGGQGGLNDFAGGFVGYLNGGTITQSFASGAVNTVGGSSGLDTGAGGFVGVVDGTSFASAISNSYATGAVTVNGTAFSDAGGFVGVIEGGAGVSFVYATGHVTGSGTVGGLAGLVGNAANAGATGGTLANSYWDEGTTGQSTGYTLSGSGAVNTVVGVGGNTGISPFQAATYAGWDFANTWSTPSAGFYPELYGVSHVLRITAGNVTSVYGSFPIYTLNIYGLQGGDGYGVVHGLQFAINGTTTSTSGFYNVGTYGLSFSGGYTNEGDPYRLIYVNGKLTVTPAVLTASLTGTVEKTYDGTTSAALASGNYTLSGLIAGDVVNLNDPTSGTYASKNAGVGILVTVNGLILTGADAGNYILSSGSASAAIGIIDPKVLVAILVGSVVKIYDGTTSATLAADNYALSGVIAGDSVNLNDPTSGTYATQNAGSGILVTANGLILTGADAGNYILSSGSASAAIGVIDPRVLMATLVGTVEKTFDGTTAAILMASNYDLTGALPGDSVSLNDPTTGTYAVSYAGTGIVVTVNGLALTGAQAGDYVVNFSASAPIGTIDAAPAPIQTNIVTSSPSAQLSNSDDPGAAADAGSPPAGVVDAGSTTDAGAADGSDQSGSTSADASASAAAVAAAAAASKSAGTPSVFPVSGGGDNDRNGGDSSPVTGGGNRDLWTGSEEGGLDCPADVKQPCPASQGGKP